jgi:hypothetical protein
MLEAIRDAPYTGAAWLNVAAIRARQALVETPVSLRRAGRRPAEYAAVWVVVFILAVFVIAAAALAVYCLRAGRNGAVIDFNVSKWYKGFIPVGIRVEIYCA